MRPLCFHSRREGPPGAEMGTGNNGPSSSLGEKEERREKGRDCRSQRQIQVRGKEVQVARRRCHLSALVPCHPKGLFAKPRNTVPFMGSL